MLRVLADANVLISAALAKVLARPRLRKYLTYDESLRFVSDLAGQTTLLSDPPGPHPAELAVEILTPRQLVDRLS